MMQWPQWNHGMDNKERTWGLQFLEDCYKYNEISLEFQIEGKKNGMQGSQKSL